MAQLAAFMCYQVHTAIPATPAGSVQRRGQGAAAPTPGAGDRHGRAVGSYGA